MALRFEPDVDEIPSRVRDEMRGRSWHEVPECVPFASLRLVRMPFITTDGTTRRGEMVVAATVVDDVLHVFERLFDARFPIARMERVDAFDGNDDASMAANNTSAFNHRTIAGTTRLSHHARGIAIDINPRWNPMIVRGAVHPPAAIDSVDRSRLRPGMIGRPGIVVEAFESRGWEWGGDFRDFLDLHHFSKDRFDVDRAAVLPFGAPVAVSDPASSEE